MTIAVSSVDIPARPPDLAAPDHRPPPSPSDTARERAAQPPPRAPLPPGQGTRIDVLA